MKLKLHENIKRLRKEKNLTQDKLAEILGVTVGAVSRWENENNTPDIVMLTTIASFFDVSVDALLGYDVASKKAKDIVARIDACVAEHNFEEAIELSRDALNRYPHDFAVIYSSAMVYQVRALERQDKEDAIKAIDLLTGSLQYLSQNNNPELNEYDIKMQIAYNYLLVDKKVALEKYKEINFAGINNISLAYIHLQNGELDRALNYCTLSMIDRLAEFIDASICMIMALAGKGKKKDIDEAICLAKTLIDVIGQYSKDEVGRFSKLQASCYALLAYLYERIGDEAEVKKYVRKGKKLAESFDENGAEDIAKCFRFYHAEKEQYFIMDSIGENAVEGIEKMLRKQISNMGRIDKKALNKIIDYWEKE